MEEQHAHLIIEKGPEVGQQYVLTEEPAVIGRLKAAAIWIDDTRVSRQHARISRRGDTYWLEDLGSSNGTFVNGQKLTAPQLLTDGDLIEFGQAIELRFSFPPAAAAPATVIASQPVGWAPDTTMISQHPSESPPPAAPPAVAGPPEPLPARESGVPEQTTVAASSGMQATMIGPAAEASRAPASTGGQRPPISAPSSGLETMIGQTRPEMPEIIPQLVVSIAGRPPKVYDLGQPGLRLGRAADNDIVVDYQMVSRYHATLQRSGRDYQLIPSPNATNPIYVNGRPVRQSVGLVHGDRLRIGGTNPGEMVSLVYLGEEESEHDATQTIRFAEDSNLVAIGRDRQNDIVLDAPIVSRFHAQIERVGQRYRITDLRSSNGTFVNDVAIDGETWLKAADTIGIGPYRFVMGQDELAQIDTGRGMRIEAINLNKWVRKDLNILQDISLVFEPSEFVVVVGQSGGGKSTLLDAINGYRPATHGQVLVNDVDVYKDYDAIRTSIGFVPQRDIIHMELTVYQALDYAARLRMPPDTSSEERHQRIMEVLDDLDLAHRKDVQISGLSGGQQKRVSIGVELLTKPGLFFLDEPTSGLDPGTETALMQLMRRLADQGRTIVLITHATKNVMLADKVVFLARGGYLAWFGPPDEALNYFDQFRSDRDRRSREIEFDEIYSLLDDPEKGKAADWAERFRQTAAYQEYVARPLEGKLAAAQTAATSTAVAAKPAAPHRRQRPSLLRQLGILSSRNIKILTRDRASLLLMLFSTPLIAMLDFVLATGMGRNPFSFMDGDMNKVIVSLIVLTNNAIMVGGLSHMRELVKEREIYRRERMVNLQLMPYILSKVWVVVILSFYQAFFFVLIRQLAFEMPGGMQEIIYTYITLVLLVMAGSMLGLFVSALSPNANSAPLILILFLIPQIVLSGAMVPLPQPATTPASSRWAFQAIMAINGAGSDVDRDACWELPEDERDALTSEEKDEQCICMGINALREEMCSFPGVGQFYDDAVDTADPAKPADLRPEPTMPALPPAPVQPTDPGDTAALQQFLLDMEAYTAETDAIRRDFEAEMDAYRDDAAAYAEAMEDYQTELAELQVARATATGSAETLISTFHTDFGWTFVDKEADSYTQTLFLTWGAQAFIILVLFTGTVLLQRRWDR